MLSDLQTAQKSASNVVFDLSRNKKQQIFFDQVMMAVAGKSDLRYFFYGGAVRGGKTSVCLALLILLAKKFKGSRWHVVRDSFTTLEETTIPSMEKFCPESKTVKWNRNKSNYHIHFLENGSKIYMTSESINQDPDLLWMDGLETNGIFLEQIEGISKKMYDKSRERAGSWIIDPMPPALIFGTTNPTLTWPKAELYEKHRTGSLRPPFYFLEALPDDNPFVTQDQWAAWKTLDTVSYNARIKGDWSSFAVNKPFAHAFKEKKHLLNENEEPFDFEYDSGFELMLSFDFNVSPMTCVAAQYIDGRIRFVREFRVNNSSTKELCQMVKSAYPNALLLVTGDATGRNRSALTGGTLNHYIVIKQELELLDTQMKQPTFNPSNEDARVLVNSILENFPPAYNACCKYLIEDLRYVEVDNDGKIDKKTDPERSHLLDGHNYLLNTFFSHLLRAEVAV